MDSTTEKDDLVGSRVDDLMSQAGASSVSSTSAVSSSGHKNSLANSGSRPGQFGLGDRAENLLTREGLQAAILLPHSAVKTESKVNTQT